MHHTQADAMLKAFGATFDELAAAIGRVPDDDEISDQLTDGLADTAEQVAALDAVSREGLLVQARVADYQQQHHLVLSTAHATLVRKLLEATLHPNCMSLPRKRRLTLDVDVRGLPGSAG